MNGVRQKASASVDENPFSAAADMESLYRAARERLNAKLQKHVLSGGGPLEGKRLVRLIEDLSEEYGSLERKFRERFGRAVPYVAEGYYFDALHDLGKPDVIGRPDAARIRLMKEDAFSHVAGVTQNMRKTDVMFLRQASADVFREAAMTGVARDEAARGLLAKILMRPEKFTFVDSGGRAWDNRAYCRMLARTVLLNAGRQSYFDACAANGDDVVRVTVSGNACPACAVWENRLLSISGATKGLPTVEEATAAGLCHPNCTHSFVAVGDYLREQDFTEDGRPKQGPNSSGKEAKDDPEAWRQYRLSGGKKPKPASPPKPRETPEEHRAGRERQREAARENRVRREAELIGAERIQVPHSRDSDLIGTNPHFDTGEEQWTNNCQRCVSAYEARRRGINVTAKPLPPDDQLRYGFGWASVYQQGPERIVDCSAITGAKARKNVERQVLKAPDGSRFIVQVYWKDGEYGHVFIAENEQGAVRFVDPQRYGDLRQFDCSSHWNQAGGKDCYVLRVDNLKFGDKAKECCKPVEVVK